MRGLAIEDNLNLDDADFVMTIHTDIVLGDPTITGHAAFYVNKGFDQPTCPKILFFWYDTICENRQAQVFWTEGIKSRSATIFPARRCNSYEDFHRRLCDPRIPIGYMNPKASANLTGKYYLNTFRVPPYARGNDEP